MTTDAAGHAGTAPLTQTWKWNSDAFAELHWLDRFGDQGWEIERVDRLARFVSHRPISGAQRWEYRRETVAVGGGREPAVGLAAEGWEPCGTWMRFRYFKRPKAAGIAPLDVLPPVPSRRVYWSRRFYLFIAIWLLSMTVGFTGLVMESSFGFFLLAALLFTVPAVAVQRHIRSKG
ncbi:hypothetical protein [Actinomadura alba]|uniref:DUF2812 domain-containing protein n=1 Tax=Actinomadura alba TaxID=406431 RepID=A0ABR7LSX2_9ACTN|nr:hypothetical protein [Actinomadura alba]MBC6467947.1 hypothetical protein [Actinomadura alba]